MSPRALAATVVGTIVAATLALLSFDLFLLAVIVALVVWLAVAIDRHATVRAENKSLKARLAVVGAEYARLDQDNMRMAARLAELQLTTDVSVAFPPRLRVVRDVPVSDSWLENAISEQMLRPDGSAS